jgi:hypothetical protein
VFDLDAGPVTITLPDAGNRFMTMMLVDEDHYAPVVFYGKGTHALDGRQGDEEPTPADASRGITGPRELLFDRLRHEVHQDEVVRHAGDGEAPAACGATTASGVLRPSPSMPSWSSIPAAGQVHADVAHDARCSPASR